MRKHVAACYSIVLLLIACLSPAISAAADRQWYRYDSDFFEAYSDAEENDVRELLGELENFRRMVITLAGIKVPDGAVKTQVLIFRSKGDFSDTYPDRNVSAYMSTVTGVPYIVMPVKARRSDSRQFIRHEFTHVLQAYSQTRLPPWYIEGFAEFMSGVEFLDDEDVMYLGYATGRPVVAERLVDWDELVSDEFRFHEIHNAERANNAYVQAWILVHYLTLGDGMAYNERLIRYLSAFAKGAPSIDAFYGMFEETPAHIGERVLRRYQREFDPLPLAYSPVDAKSEFRRSEVNGETVQRMVDGLKIRNGVRPD